MMNFLKENKRFTFLLGDKNAWDVNYKSESLETEDTLTTTYFFEGGLKITNIAKKYKEFGAYEWVNWIENISDEPTEIISELWDCASTFPLEGGEIRNNGAYFPDDTHSTKLYAPSGSQCNSEEFHCRADETIGNIRLNHLCIGKKVVHTASGGRSSEEKAPYFNVHINGKGYIFAVGWTGQWKCEFEREEDGVIFKAKVEDTHFRVLPGEKFRTASVVVLPYEGDIVDAHNQWRRLSKKHFSLLGKEGRDIYGPLCANVWGGMKSEAVIERVEFIKKNNLPFEYLWMDAGWFGEGLEPSADEFESRWFWHTGDWRISELIHPKGLKDVSKAIHDAGLKFLLWLEPERVWSTAPGPKEHPEYYLTNKGKDSKMWLLNLGNDGGWQYCFDSSVKLIEDLKLDCYRNDFNIAPLDYWRTNDAEDRQGICEIKYINGLYNLYDALLEKFPHLIIDNCASGGRRIDIEMSKRSIPLWRSDYQCKANCDVDTTQIHHLNFNMWMPYSGTGSGRTCDEYRIRSSYDAAMSTNYFFSEKESMYNTEEKIIFLKKYLEEYLKARPYFTEDFYPLTEPSVNLDVWCAAQFNRPSQKDGIVQVFRREKSVHETAFFQLRGIEEDSNYLFEDADGGEFILNGKELRQKGFQVTISERRKAKLFFYKKYDGDIRK